jgi:hypothetical protein
MTRFDVGDTSESTLPQTEEVGEPIKLTKKTYDR